MAFGKKKDEQAPGGAAAEAGEPEASLESAFAGGAEAPAEADAAAPEPAAEAVPEAPPADALAGGTDDLLSAFQTGDAEAVDNSFIVELAGEHDIDDLLEELHTVASALGIVLDEDEAA